jgi:hypothetical protein
MRFRSLSAADAPLLASLFLEAASHVPSALDRQRRPARPAGFSGPLREGAGGDNEEELSVAYAPSPSSVSRVAPRAAAIVDGVAYLSVEPVEQSHKRLCSALDVGDRHDDVPVPPHVSRAAAPAASAAGNGGASSWPRLAERTGCGVDPDLQLGSVLGAPLKRLRGRCSYHRLRPWRHSGSSTAASSIGLIGPIGGAGPMPSELPVL